MTNARVVFVTAPSEAVAVKLCRSLVDERLVACGTVVPGARSVYRWKDEVRDEGEALIVLKTDRSRVAEVVSRIPEIHPYEVPEVLVLTVEAGHEPYLSWISDETRSAGRKGAEGRRATGGET